MWQPGLLVACFVMVWTCGGYVEAQCNSDPEAFNCDNYNQLICAPDSIPFCLTNGTKVTGSCAAKRAVCLEQAYLDTSHAACDPSVTTTQSSHANLLDCACYNSTGLCRHDLHVFCLTNGTRIFGSCSALQAVCHERAHVDVTEASCPATTTQHSVLDCASYLATGLCHHDMHLFCLSNGTTIQGSCNALKAVCSEHASLYSAYEACPATTLFDCVSYNASGHCILDMHIFCLSNGSTIHGTCSALKAVCHEHATVVSCEKSVAAQLLASTVLLFILIAACATALGRSN